MKRRLPWMVVAAGLMAVLAGCGAFTTLVDTQNALQDAGYSSVKVSPDNRADTLHVQVTVAAPPTTQDAHDVAAIVWQKFHERFVELYVTVRGTGPQVQENYSFGQLQASFGARNPAWNRDTVSSGVTRAGIAVIVGVVVVLGVVVTLIVVVQRRNRRRRPPWPGNGPWPGGGSGPGSGPWPGGGSGPGYALPVQPGYPPPVQPGYPPPPPAYPPRPRD